MNKTLFALQSRIFRSGFNTRGKIQFALTLLFLLGFYNLKSQTSKVIPENFVTGGFLGPLTNSTRTIQLLIDDSQLTTLAGKYLTSISFRLPTTASASWPSSDTTFQDYQIYLSDSVDPANRQLNFLANVVGSQTQVRSGSLLVPAGVLTSGGNPNAFTFEITFNTPYLYTGSNLLIEIRHTGSNGSSLSTHATSTSTAGYGTLYSACWASTGNVMNANFSYVKINSIDNLGVKSVTIDNDLSVYPNPVKDNLFVKMDKEITEFIIFNVAGQKVLHLKNNSKSSQVDVSNLTKGTYILQIIDREGNSRTSKFIKN